MRPRKIAKRAVLEHSLGFSLASIVIFVIFVFKLPKEVEINNTGIVLMLLICSLVLLIMYLDLTLEPLKMLLRSDVIHSKNLQNIKINKASPIWPYKKFRPLNDFHTGIWKDIYYIKTEDNEIFYLDLELLKNFEYGDPISIEYHSSDKWITSCKSLNPNFRLNHSVFNQPQLPDINYNRAFFQRIRLIIILVVVAFTFTIVSVGIINYLK